MRPDWTRRSFLMAVGASMPLLPAALQKTHDGSVASTAPDRRTKAVPAGRSTWDPRSMSVQDVIDLIVAEIPDAPRDETVDTVKSGDPTVQVTGVATTFLATTEVIERAAAAGANLIITHEPTFYNHLDEVDWLERDAIYRHKRALLDKHGIVVWRFHDYWHDHEPDGILTGFLKQLGWEDRAVSETDRAALPATIELPTTTVAGLARDLKAGLGIARPLQVVGDPEMMCRRVGLLPGMYGGRSQIDFLGSSDVDVLVVGEINEWETAVYVQDAVSSGHPTALIILGHVPSEEPGMAWLAEWLQPRIKQIPVVHVPTKDPFTLI